MSAYASSQALIIGVGRYDYFADLLDTHMDATAMAAVLRDPRYGGYAPERVHLLGGPVVSRDDILDGLSTLSRGATDDSTTIFYFSGHGGSVESHATTVYLCPSDANPAHLAQTALSRAALSDALVTIPTRRLLVIIDTCHAAGAATLKSAPPMLAWRDEPPPQYYRELGVGAGRVIFASSRRDQPSRMLPSERMSLFTYYLVEGLKGRARPSDDGAIHVFELFDYISNAMRAVSSQQTPILAAADVDADFPVVLHQPAVHHERRAPSSAPDTIAEIHELLVQRPRAGAQALAAFLRRLPYEVLETADIHVATVETNVGELLRIEDRMRAFAETPDLRVARLGVIDYLISVCIKWERFERQ